MGNKRSWASKNKKPNNWKYIKRTRDTKQKSEIQKCEEESHSPSAEFLKNEPVDETISIAMTNCITDSERESSNIEILPRQERTTSPEIVENTSVETHNFYACLSQHVEEDETEINDVAVDPLFDANENENSIDSDVDENYCNAEGSGSEESNSEESNSDEICSDSQESGSEESNDDVITDDESSTEDEEVILKGKVSGRRIFEVAELFENIKKIGNHSKNCTFKDMTLIGETKKGLNSIFKFRCEKCGAFRKLQSNPKKPNSFTCNEEAVLAINLIGSGFSHLEEFLSNLNVPCMGGTLYNSISKIQQSDWVNLAEQSALSALHEEIQLAIAAGEVDAKGNALIAIIADGGWAKRSYGKKFNSLSGCAVLVGVKTKKVVFFGTRSKYCHVCKIAQSNNTPVREHECNINYHGPSSGMEADIILEGFKHSEQHGARFHKIIADGDSSTYKILRDYRVYKDPDLVIEKLECVNHLCRNFRSKFGFLEKVCKFDSKLRKQVKPSKGSDICKGVKAAAKYYRNLNLTLSEKMDRLEDDIMNCPLHYFGVHTKCKPYFCSKTTATGALQNVKLLKEDGLWYEILNLVQIYFASNSKSLIENHTNNPAEEFNNLVAKYLGGKRINYSLARSYVGRVGSAVVQYNSKGHAGTEFRKFVLGPGQESSTKKLELSRKRKLITNAAALATKPRNRHQKEDNASGEYFHGDGFEELDMPTEKFERSKKIFLKKIQEKQRIRKRIERTTLDKKYDSYWMEIRQDLLPSNHFASIVKTQSRQTLTKKLQEIMYNRTEFGNNAQNMHQRLVQREALDKFKEIFADEIVQECGLFIDKELPYLCSSPFRLCGKTHILSVKCPKKQYNKSFADAMKTLSFFKKKADHFIINEKSDWFMELQGDMHITERKFAYLMIYLGETSYRIIEIAKNDNYFDEIKPQLSYFYMEVMLKELVDSRKRRRMDLRKYDVATDSFI